MGASTWALGNHRWSPYRGILTIKAIMQPSHIISLVQDGSTCLVLIIIVNKFRDPQVAKW